MNYRPQHNSRILAFTLVELLTVITIIAILMGLLFPAIGIAKDQARKAEARVAVNGIAAAVKAYYTEYGKYPLGTATPDPTKPAGITDVTFGDGVKYDNSIVFNALRNLPDTDGVNYDPRAIVFFDGKLVTDNTNPKSGFLSADGANGMKKGAYIDPWGNEYRIVIDADYDNQIIVLPYTDFNTTATYPRTGVAVFSLGKDGKLGTKGDNQYRNTTTNTTSDDIVSWQ